MHDLASIGETNKTYIRNGELSSAFARVCSSTNERRQMTLQIGVIGVGMIGQDRKSVV